MSYPRITVFKGVSGEWYWQLVARNGRITADNESHPTRAKAVRAAKAMIQSIVKRVVPLSAPVLFRMVREDKERGIVEIEFE
jgi:uncharacterized protein YegP (UPF0339 family)